MKVHLVTPENTDAHRDNIRFVDGGPWPRKWGEWPEGHPCAVGAGLQDLSRFRAAGYADASCYPEGDGLCYSRPAGKTRADIIADIETIFDWQVDTEGEDW
jgi:hypothetical protein